MSVPPGLTSEEARARLLADGPNVLHRARPRSHVRELARQFWHPLALLLWFAAAISLATDSAQLALVIVCVLAVNALFAFAQELQAERAVEALGAYLPEQASVTRDHTKVAVPVAQIVVGDLVSVCAGDRIPADGVLVSGQLEVDMSALTGESAPVLRRPAPGTTVTREDTACLYSGTLCGSGDGAFVVTSTGMRTELGRIAELTSRVEDEASPLEVQVRNTAALIAVVAVVMGIVFMLVGTIAAGLSPANAATFAIGLLVANVPEGLLPTITLALAVGVRLLARNGAIVKRLSAVETLGSTNVICTDKTGTLTRNEMSVQAAWVPSMDGKTGANGAGAGQRDIRSLFHVMVSCNNTTLGATERADPTERSLVEHAIRQGLVDEHLDVVGLRRLEFPFDGDRKLMSTVDTRGQETILHTKGAPEEVLERCTTIRTPAGEPAAIDALSRDRIAHSIEQMANQGLRVLAGARRRVDSDGESLDDRDTVERDLEFVGLVGLADALRPEVPDAVGACRAAGIRIIVITGDHSVTARVIAREAGIVTDPDPLVLTGEQVADMQDDQLGHVLDGTRQVVFARSSPETKLRIATSLQALGNVVAMTGDGVNDAPALRRADIGVAMGRVGTDVAREAADMILTDDNFATIVQAVREGRVVYSNIRKFIVYVFAHATPEVVPFLAFALSGGALPLPLTAAQILAIDLGTETLPALALGREPAEPGLMERPPRNRTEPIVTAGMMVRSWLFLGAISAVLVMAGFFFELLRAGWHPGVGTDAGSPLHEAYLRATTMTFLGIVACQVGTAFASRTERASLRAVGFTTNRLLFKGIAFEIVFAAAIVWIPSLRPIFGTAPVDALSLAFIAPFPVIVWGADEIRRWRVRVHSARHA